MKKRLLLFCTLFNWLWVGVGSGVSFRFVNKVEEGNVLLLPVYRRFVDGGAMLQLLRCWMCRYILFDTTRSSFL
ncbi:hypothetical protein M1146_00125, partial [Patescibacteria group bacterium]|nr:hypothetical protein [Patescibacteria group bacterium]